MSSLKLKESSKSYQCFKCGRDIIFKTGQYKVNALGKSIPKPFNSDGTEHSCNGTGGNFQEAKKRTSGSKYWNWYWGYGPGRYHKLNEQRYSSDEYKTRKEKAKQQYNSYRQQYTTTMSREDAVKILGLDMTIIKLRFYESHKLIRDAYCKLALRFHPDRNHSPEAPALFRQATEAYELLSEKRVY